MIARSAGSGSIRYLRWSGQWSRYHRWRRYFLRRGDRRRNVFLEREVSGSVVIDSSAGTLIYSGPAGSGLAFGTVEDKILNVNGVDHSYAVATYVFDTITLGSSVIVQVKGSNSVLLKTRNHGDIDRREHRVEGFDDGTAGA